MSGTPTYSVGMIAKLLRLTERRVQQLSKEGVIPKSDRGRYELAPAVQGYIKFLQDRAAPEMGGAVGDYPAEKARLTKAQADLAEINLAKEHAQLIPAADIAKVWHAITSEVTANLLNNVPVRAAARIKGEKSETKIKASIKDEIARVLESFAKADADRFIQKDEADADEPES